MNVTARPPATVAGTSVEPGERGVARLEAGRLISGQPISIPVHVLHGAVDGPTVWLSAAVHGDEILGVEIIRRVLEVLDPQRMRGTVLAVPIVNVHGFNTGDRYLPDRRDLNRSFPGSPRGSTASRLAHTLLTEVVDRCSLGIDLHTGSAGRMNLPQIRADLDDERARLLSGVFGAPVAIASSLRDGSLRQVGTERGATVLLYEGGEAHRFDAHALDVGTAGVLRVLAHEGLHPGPVPDGAATVFSPSSAWIRTTRSGIVHALEPLGALVEKGQDVARVYSATGQLLASLRTRRDGIVIGLAQQPLANRGDAVCHVAAVDADPVDLKAALADVPAVPPPTAPAQETS